MNNVVNPIRLDWLDIAKGIAILLVVLGHSAQYYLYPEIYESSIMWRVIYAFHMPFFFILSGYAAGISKSSSFNGPRVLKKTERLLFPYFAWRIISFPLVILYKGWSWARLEDFIYEPSAAGLWYLWALFFIWLIYSFIVHCIGLPRWRVLIGILTYFGLLYISETIGGHYGLFEISKYFIYYLIGYELCLSGVLNNIRNITPTALYIAAVSFLLLFLCLLEINIEMDGNYVFKRSYNILIALTGSAFFIIVSFVLSQKNVIFKQALNNMGKRTLGIYALNTYFIIFFSILFQNDRNFYLIVLTLVIIGSYWTTVLLSHNKLTSKFLLGMSK